MIKRISKCSRKHLYMHCATTKGTALSYLNRARSILPMEHVLLQFWRSWYSTKQHWILTSNSVRWT
jgi:hypothetical protein